MRCQLCDHSDHNQSFYNEGLKYRIPPNNKVSYYKSLDMDLCSSCYDSHVQQMLQFKERDSFA